jgi:hypothetical protein
MDYKYVDLIIKLQELADPARGGYEGERASAAAKAEALMMKHKIAQGTVDIRRRSFEPRRRSRPFVPDPPMTAARVARLNGIDPVTWRRFLRAQGVRREDYEIFSNPARREDLVRRFRARHPSR